MLKTFKKKFDVHLPPEDGGKPRFVKTIQVEVYRNFGEEFLTPESMEIIERTKANYLGLLTGEEIRSLRLELGLSQSEFSSLLKCGKKSLSRWENGQGYPSGLVNTLLRLLEDRRIGVADLKAIAGAKQTKPRETFLAKRQDNVIHYAFPQGDNIGELGDIPLASNS